MGPCPHHFGPGRHRVLQGIIAHRMSPTTSGRDPEAWRGPLPRAPALPVFLPLTHLFAGRTALSGSLNHLHRGTACAPDEQAGSEKEGDWLRAAPRAALPSTARGPAVQQVGTWRPPFSLYAGAHRTSAMCQAPRRVRGPRREEDTGLQGAPAGA